VIFIINNSTGQVTRHVGIVLKIVAGVGQVKMDDVTRCILLFMAAEFVVMFLMVVFPWLIAVPAKWLRGMASRRSIRVRRPLAHGIYSAQAQSSGRPWATSISAFSQSPCISAGNWRIASNWARM